ncbi:hypothetical protein MBLNU230_g3679t1 [Neophaeotheca triangularis]
MAPNKKRTRVDEFNDLVSSAPAKDFNPDDSDQGPTNSDDDSDAASEIDDSAGRDHYVDVGKAKLRGKGETALGPQYRGSKVSRGQAEEEEDEDGPFGFEDGREESSEEDEEMGEGSESESGDEEEEEEEEEEGGRRAELRRIMAEGGGDEEDIEEDDHAEAPEVKPVVDGDSREELRRTMAEEQKTGTASIMQAAKADAEKGRAVKRQRTAFDSLLNMRIKLQKSLIATNTMVDMPANTLSKETSTAASAAETAAFNLWSTLTDFREELSAARTGSKRKHSQFTADTPIADLLTHQQSQEEASLPHRNATLRKWSEKARPQTALAQRSKLNNTTAQASIVDVLNEHLSDTSRLLTRAQTPRSCAPVQLAAKTPHDARIYDDADFYGLLLKELLEQKSADSVASASYSNSLDLSMQMRRDAKTKRQVDTKASKGRKLRYNVHEKLQNFMAPEDRRQWGDRQADELFAGLFGQRLGLAEETGDGEVDGEEAEGGDGLMLFSR